MKLKSLGSAVIACAVGVTCFAAPALLPSAQSGLPCAVDQAHAATTVKKPSKKVRTKFKKATARFSIDLFKRSVEAQGSGKNTLVSPPSVVNAVGLMANGSAGSTRTEMRKVLANGMKIKKLDKSLRWFDNQLTNAEGAKLTIANSIWYRNDGLVTIKKSFLKKNKKYLGATVKKVDFREAASVDAINGWASDNTNGLIKKVIDQLSDDDMSVLVNALYFNAKWAVPYEPDSAVKQQFTPAKGDAHKVDMLHGSEYNYIEGKVGDSGVTGFIKPYVKGYQFVALLPDEGVKLKDFTSALTGSKFTSLVKKAQSTKVVTTMPKLDITYSDDEMQEQLAAMGLVKSTSEDKADFSKMGKAKLGNLYMGQVIHKTRLKLDEDGTEAAAVTAVIAKASSAMPFDPPKVVELNRPFVYAIIDSKTKLPIFLGTVNDVK